MVQDLLAVLDWEPDFAEAHNMLAMARFRAAVSMRRGTPYEWPSSSAHAMSSIF